MANNRIIFTGEKESYIVRVLIGKVQEAGIDCEFIPCTVDAINDNWDEASLLILYMDIEIRSKEKIFHFLTDIMEEKNGQLILIGEQIDIDYVCDHIPSDVIYKTFARPVDNAVFTKTITDYFNKRESGEFKKSILVVDDDPQFLSLIRQWLKDTYKVSMVGSGLQALKFLGKNKVDLILLDHEMPVTSGPKVLEMLRSDDETKDIPVMFLTGKSDKESVLEVVSLKPEGYFLKNITREELLEKLNEYFMMHKNHM